MDNSAEVNVCVSCGRIVDIRWNWEDGVPLYSYLCRNPVCPCFNTWRPTSKKAKIQEIPPDAECNGYILSNDIGQNYIKYRRNAQLPKPHPTSNNQEEELSNKMIQNIEDEVACRMAEGLIRKMSVSWRKELLDRLGYCPECGEIDNPNCRCWDDD